MTSIAIDETVATMKNPDGRATVTISACEVDIVDRLIKRIRKAGFATNRAEALRVALDLLDVSGTSEAAIRGSLTSVRLNTAPKRVS